MEGKPEAPRGIGASIRSPEIVLMVVAGVAVAILGPYALYRLGPHVPKVSTEEVKSSPPGIDLDVTDLDTLPDSLRDGAMLLLTTETPELPDAIKNLAVANGENVLRPVSEAVEETQPILYWSAAFAAPPYSISISDDRNQVIARAVGIQNTSWMVLTPLRRGGEYTWRRLPSAAPASRRPLVPGALMTVKRSLWRNREHASRAQGFSPDHIGLVAQQLGMLAIAERGIYRAHQTVSRLNYGCTTAE